MLIIRYIFTSLLKVFLGTLAVLCAVLLIVQWIRIGNILTINDIDVLFLAMVPLSGFVIPMALLFSILMVLERLSSESEVIAMKASGVRSRTICTPIIVLSVVAMLANGAISTYLGPISMKQIESQLLQNASKRIFSFIKEREFDDTFKGILYYIESINPRKRQFRNVFIETSGKERAVITSEMGTLEAARNTIIMRLKNGSVFMSARHTDRYFTFDEYCFALEADLSNRLNIKTFETATQMEFRRYIKHHPDPKTIKEYYNRFAFPVLDIILGLVGISFGFTKPRSPHFTGFIIGLCTIVVYYLFFTLSDRLVKGNMLDPLLGAWLPDMIFSMMLAAVWIKRKVRPGEGGV